MTGAMIRAGMGRARAGPGRAAVAGLILLLAVLVQGGAVRAQDSAAGYPPVGEGYVVDLARVLGSAEVERIEARLAAARADPGVEIAVVTIRRRRDHSPGDTLAGYARGLFNHWGLGAAGMNDGVLIVVATEDREARITLGSVAR